MFKLNLTLLIDYNKLQYKKYKLLMWLLNHLHCLQSWFKSVVFQLSTRRMLHTDPRSSQQWPQERAKSTWRTSSPTTRQQLALKLVRNFVSSIIGNWSIPISQFHWFSAKESAVENQPLNVDSDSSPEKWWSRVASTGAIAVYFMHITRDSIGSIVIC